MQVFVAETPVGLFFIDNQENVIERELFVGGPAEAAVQLRQLQEGKPNARIIEAMKRVAKLHQLIFENELLGNAAREAGLEVSIRPDPAIQKFRNRLSSDSVERENWLKAQSLDIGVTRTTAGYNEFARQVTLQIARTGIAIAATKRDLSAVQAMRAVDDLDKTLNLLAGRVREWYGLHFPEMDRLIENHDTYARLVAKLGDRRNFTLTNLLDQGLPKETAEQLTESASKSMGGEIEDQDLAVLRSFCELMLELYKFRAKSESYVEDVLKQVAPNMTAIVGAALSARLISIAGSLNNLAKMPASTLQVLGAEKALFRSLKTGARPPKHGVIFQHTAIHQAPRWQRGKIARTLSGKLTIAARVDAFKGEFVGDKLKDDVNKKIDGIKERYKTAPPSSGPPPPPPSRERFQRKRDFGRKRKTR
ncbi:MAG TPA: C/D box methylation guide ribonucleoprotein complex aNOP56 subunit [Candidatus Bathyarchaeia archaeon]|nr:C/D box methylation guide ribonucleoprotein complex aNOP56 subunit [Candidatus Bathyarchaeia archaeon]